MTTPPSTEQDINKLICEIADAVETMTPRQPLRDFFAKLFLTPKKRLERAVRRSKAATAALLDAPSYPRFAEAYMKMLDALERLKNPPFNLTAMDRIINTLNCLNRAGMLSDAHKQEAVRIRHALDSVSLAETYEDSYGGASGSDPCPPTYTTVTRTPASLDF